MVRLSCTRPQLLWAASLTVAWLSILVAGTSSATTIAVDTLLTNGSFETPTTQGSCPSGWNCGGSPGFGVYAPTSAQYTPGTDGLSGSSVVPDGKQAAYSPTGLSGSGTMQQIITTAQYQAGDTYTFTFWAGLPKTEPDGTTSVSAWPGTVRVYFLEGASGVQDGLPAFDIAAPALGQWEEQTLTVTAAQLAASGATGQDIGIEFFLSGTNNQVADFDIGDGGQFHSDPPPAPEPASLALFGAGLAGLAAIRRRKKT